MPSQIRFPHWLSAWWIVIFVAIGWGPLVIADSLLKVFPALDKNYAVSAFGMSWGLTVALGCTGLSGLSSVCQLIRLFSYLLIRNPDRQ